LGVAHVATQVHVSTYDLAYGNGIYGTRPLELRFQAGARWGSATFEDSNEGIGVMARESTSFYGLGPMASVYGKLILFGSGRYAEICAGHFGQATGSVLFGRTRQIDEELITWPNALSYRYVQADREQFVPNFSFSIGIFGRARESGPAIMIGYQFEEWQHVGHVGASNFDLAMHGIFIRCTYNY
jgi:hypothetical protein